MTLLLQILQTMLLTAVIICLVWTATSFSKNNTGYRWRKYLWLLLAVRLIIPINFDMPGYNAPINIAVTSEGIKSSNRFSSNAFWNELISAQPNTIGTLAGISENAVSNTSEDGTLASIDTTLSEDTSSNSASPAVETGFIQSLIRLLYKAAASKITVVTVLALWLTVTLVLGVLRVLQYIYARKKYLSCSEVCTDKELLSSIEEICSEYGIKKAPVILNCSLHTSPILMGYIKTMLIIPDLDYTEAELNYVIRHELNHYKAKDLWYKLLMVVLCDLYWFNPALRLMKHMAFQDTEFVCDENTTKVLNPAGKNAYCNTLLKVMAVASCSNLSFTTQFAGGKKKAMKRFENVFTFHNKKVGFAILSLILAAVIATTACVSLKGEDIKTTGETRQEVLDTENNETNPQEDETGDKISISLGDIIAQDELSDLQAAFPDYDISLKESYTDYDLDSSDESFIEHAPTVFSLSYYSEPYNYSPGKFADITDILDERGYLDNMSDEGKKFISDNQGRVVTIPNIPSYSFCLFCNAELFEAAGLVDENGKAILPTTWEDVAESAKAIKEATGKKGLDLGQLNVFSAAEFVNIAWNFGAEDFGQITERNGIYTANLNSESAIAAMEYIKDLRWKYDVLAYTPASDNYVESFYDTFLSGETAMCISFADINISDLETNVSPEKIAVTAIPANPDNIPYTEINGFKYSFSAAATEEEINAAIDCLEYLGCTPIINDVTKETLAAYADTAYLNNAYALNNYDSLFNSDIASYKYETLASEIDIKADPTEPAFANVRPLSNFKCLLSPGSMVFASYSDIIANVINEVVNDENADVKALMDKAESTWINN